MLRLQNPTCRIRRVSTYQLNLVIVQSTKVKLHWRRSLVSHSHPQPEVLPDNVTVDEERIPGHNFKLSYPANPGDVLLDRFQLISKIGWGTTSTVWLARDSKRCLTPHVQNTRFVPWILAAKLFWSRWFRPNRYFAIEICNCDTAAEDVAYEFDMSRHLNSSKSSHRGRGILGTAVAGGEIISRRGDTHLVLAFEPLREPLWLFRRRISQQDQTILNNLPLFKAYFRILLQGMDYMHTEANVIHTGWL